MASFDGNFSGKGMSLRVVHYCRAVGFCILWDRLRFVHRAIAGVVSFCYCGMAFPSYYGCRALFNF